MKLIGNIIHIQKADIEKAGISYRTAEKWSVKIKDPADRRCDLFPYHEINEKYQSLIVKSIGGDPYEYIAKEPIRNLIIKDFKAEAFYESHVFEDGSTLKYHKPGQERIYIDRYTNDASILQAIIRVLDNKKAFKLLCPGVSITQFWTIILEIISKTENTDLPNSKRRLLDHISKFKNNNYAGIISPRFGNKNRAKIGKTDNGYDKTIADKQIRTIRKILSSHNNLDNAQVANLTNVLFTKKGWQRISPATVYKVRRDYAHIIKPGNSGLRAYRNENAMQIKRTAPTYPLAMVTVDGWNVEMLYQQRVTDSKGNTKVDYNGRLVMVVVLDPFTKYPLGYAIGDRETTDLIRQAGRNALLHAQELFNGSYRPWQLQSDRYGIKNLTPFYSGVAHLVTPAAVGNAKAKVVEPYFKYLNKEYCQYDPYWSGFGITSRKENQPNTEYLNKVKHGMPDKAGLIAKIDRMMQFERNKKQAEYVQGWQFVSDEDKCGIPREQFLLAFGKQTKETIRMRGNGIAPQIKGVNYYFDTFDPKFRTHSQTDWKLIYDDFDLQSENGLKDIVAVSADNKHQFLLYGKMLVPMAVRDQEAHHHAYRATVEQFNKIREQEIIQTYIEDNEVVQELLASIPLSLDNPQETALKLMFTNNGQQKEGIQDAKRLGKIKEKEVKVLAAAQKTEVATWQDEQMAYLTGKLDFNQYTD